MSTYEKNRSRANKLVEKEIKSWNKTYSKEIWNSYSIPKFNHICLKLLKIKRKRIISCTTGKFKEHPKKINIVSDSKCKYSDEEETVKHILWS